MRRKSGDVNIAGEFMNFLRFSVAESAASTYTEKEIDTNLSAERGVMMEIHSIEIHNNAHGNLGEVAAGNDESIQFHISRESKTAIILPDNSDTILMDGIVLSRSPAIGTDAGPLWMLNQQVLRYDFPMPIPYVKPSIFAAVLGTDATGLATIRGRIGYTLRLIDREEFLELLVALQ